MCIQRSLQTEVEPMFLGIMQKFLVGADREHHGCSFAIVCQHARSPLLLESRSVVSCPAGEVSEADDVLLEFHVMDIST